MNLLRQKKGEKMRTIFDKLNGAFAIYYSSTEH
jgi:hypothetical protein